MNRGAVSVPHTRHPRIARPPVDAAEAVFYRALERGLSFKAAMGNVLTLTPPLVIAEGDLMRGLDILAGCIGAVG